MKIGLLIPTRKERKELLDNSLKIINKQTIKPDFIEIVDDVPIFKGVDITWRYKTGIERLKDKCDIIFCWEDDDWYREDYIEYMLNKWDENGKPDLFGINQTYFYHIFKEKQKLHNHKNRSSMFCTIFKSNIKIDFPRLDYFYFDMCLWNKYKGSKKLINLDKNNPVCIGVKHGLLGSDKTAGHCGKYEWDDNDNIKNIIKNLKYNFIKIKYKDKILIKHDDVKKFRNWKKLIKDIKNIDDVKFEEDIPNIIIQRFNQYYYKNKKQKKLSENKKLNTSNNGKITVIIPIYNAYNSVKKCIESVLNNTLIYCDIILINDHSTDNILINFLNSLKNIKNITLINNEKNLGFIKSVNIGFKKSKNDCVILNSDTIVPEGWLKRFVDFANSKDNLASITPWSNNSTITSFPKLMKSNDMLCELNVIDNYFKDLEPGEVKIPVGVGFCMYMTRYAINKIGYFDEIFGKGYGEEVDWCLRALKNNMFNYHIQNLFVYHEGSKSFSDKNKQIEKSSQIINERYPYYDNLIYNYNNNIVKRNKNKIIERINKRKYILISGVKSGGSIKYFNDIKNNLKHDNYDIKIIDNISYLLNKNLTSEDTIILNHFINTNIKIKDIINICKTNNVKLIICIHDFYYFQQYENHFYNFNENIHSLGLKKLKKYKLLNNIKELFDISSLIIFNSKFTYKKYKHLNISNKYKIIKPIDLIETNYFNIPKVDKNINIGIINSITKTKGRDLYHNIFKINSYRKYKIKYHIFGELDFIHENCIYHGKYNENDIFKKLKDNNIHGLLFINKYPETYSYSLTKAINSGLPILYSNIGSYKERLKNNKKYLKYKNNKSYYKFLKYIISNNDNIYGEQNISKNYIDENFYKIFSIHKNE